MYIIFGFPKYDHNKNKQLVSEMEQSHLDMVKQKMLENSTIYPNDKDINIIVKHMITSQTTLVICKKML